MTYKVIGRLGLSHTRHLKCVETFDMPKLKPSIKLIPNRVKIQSFFQSRSNFDIYKNMDLLVFDFDDTIVDGDTDGVIINFIKNMQSKQEILDRQDKIPWSDLMQQVFDVLHSEKFKMDQCERALKSFSFM